MAALITRFNSRGEVRDVKPTSFHLVGKTDNLALEIQIGSSSVVEVTLKDVFAAYLDNIKQNRMYQP